jgi:hypothetical protein
VVPAVPCPDPIRSLRVAEVHGRATVAGVGVRVGEALRLGVRVGRGVWVAVVVAVGVGVPTGGVDGGGCDVPPDDEEEHPAPAASRRTPAVRATERRSMIVTLRPADSDPVQALACSTSSKDGSSM